MASRKCWSLSIWVKQVGLLLEPSSSNISGSSFGHGRTFLGAVAFAWGALVLRPGRGTLTAGVGGGTIPGEFYSTGESPWHFTYSPSFFITQDRDCHHCAPVMPIGEHFLIYSPHSGHHVWTTSSRWLHLTCLQVTLKLCRLDLHELRRIL